MQTRGNQGGWVTRFAVVAVVLVVGLLLSVSWLRQTYEAARDKTPIAVESKTGGEQAEEQNTTSSKATDSSTQTDASSSEQSSASTDGTADDESRGSSSALPQSGKQTSVWPFVLLTGFVYVAVLGHRSRGGAHEVLYVSRDI